METPEIDEKVSRAMWPGAMSEGVPEETSTEGETDVEEVEKDTEPEAPETPEETPETPEEVPDKDETEEQPAQKGGDRSVRRIQQLVRERKAAEQALAEQAAEFERYKEQARQYQTPQATETVPQFDNDQDPNQDGGTISLTQEQLTAHIMDTVNKLEGAKSHHQRVVAWKEDCATTIKENPELDHESPQYNADLEGLVSKLVSDPSNPEQPNYNMTVSDALAQVRRVNQGAEAAGAAKASVKLARQQDESALTPGVSERDSSETGWAELERLQKTDQYAYMEAIKAGKVPKTY